MVNRMEAGHSLIDKAVDLCGSRYAVAKRLRMSESNLNQVYRGERPMPPVLAARLAELAGMDTRSAAIVAIVEGEKDPARAEELKRLFGLATVAATLLFFITAASIEPSLTSVALADANPYSPGIYTPDGLWSRSVYYVNRRADPVRMRICLC